MKLPFWADGAVFGALLVPVALSLKMICPVRVGCFADPFLVVLFAPLVILEWFFGRGAVSVMWGILFLIIFWGGIWTVLAYLYGNIVAYEKRLQNREVI